MASKRESLQRAAALLLGLLLGLAAGQEHEPAPADPRRPGGLRAPGHPEAQAWLRAYYQQPNGTPVPGSACGNRTSGGSGDDGPGLRRWLPTQRPRRRNLVLAPVGAGWSARSWLDDPAAATFDVVVIFYGDPNATFSCPLCREVHRMQGAPWRLYYNFTQRPEWAALAAGYDYVWLPDDDLRLSTAEINTFFDIMREFDLLIAQPAVCVNSEAVPSITWKPDFLNQQPQNCLRFTTWTEIMGVALNMSFFHSVARHALDRSYLGWGLDSLLPALLRFPDRRVAIVDRVCMVHPPSPVWASAEGKPDSVYRPGLAPYSAKEEERIVFDRYHYTWESVSELGGGYMAMDTLGAVPAPTSAAGGGVGGWPGGLLAPALAAAGGALLLLLLLLLLAAGAWGQQRHGARRAAQPPRAGDGKLLP